MAKKAVKRRGRPVSTGTGAVICTRCLPPLLDRIDTWAGMQEDKPVRSEAVRRLVETGLRAVEDNPEWTKEDFAKAKPFSEVFPEFGLKPRGRDKQKAPTKSRSRKL